MSSGILTLDKPRGMTSHDVIAAVRRILGIRAVGHTGTLDPDASGVLVLCIGKATGFASLFEMLEKTYWTVLQLGACTDTQDATGTVTQQAEVPSLTRDQVLTVLQRFHGSIQQMPPMYSAVKYHGQRLYQLARQGLIVERQARAVVIHALELLDQRPSQLSLSVTCSKGTYIRTLGEDIGLMLGCGAHVLHLQRARVGPFTLCGALSLDDLRVLCRTQAVSQVLMPVTDALAFLPAWPLTTQQAQSLRQHPAQALTALLPMFNAMSHTAPGYRLCAPEHHTVAIVQRRQTPTDRRQWKVSLAPV